MNTKPSTKQSGRPPNTRKRNVLSCTECHRRKQKCDREKPCHDCIERGVPQKCSYQAPLTPNRPPTETISGKYARLRRIVTGSEVVLTAESINALQGPDPQDYFLGFASLTTCNPNDIFASAKGTNYYGSAIHNYSIQRSTAGNLTDGFDPWFLGGFDPFSALPEQDGEPIPKVSLIYHFLQRLAPWLSTYDDTLTPFSPRLSWLPFALNHAPLFYATCLCAAVHLDRFSPVRDQRKLLWYKVETLRLKNQALSIPSEGATDQMILVALILLHFNTGGGNLEEYQAHLNGIHQMLQVRGGLQNLGMRGMVKNWLDICYGPWNKGFRSMV